MNYENKTIKTAENLNEKLCELGLISYTGQVRAHHVETFDSNSEKELIEFYNGELRLSYAGNLSCIFKKLEAEIKIAVDIENNYCIVTVDYHWEHIKGFNGYKFTFQSKNLGDTWEVF